MKDSYYSEFEKRVLDLLKALEYLNTNQLIALRNEASRKASANLDVPDSYDYRFKSDLANWIYEQRLRGITRRRINIFWRYRWQDALFINLAYPGGIDADKYERWTRYFCNNTLSRTRSSIAPKTPLPDSGIYYLENGKQLGPFSLEALKKEPIKYYTMVWYPGIEEWTPASKINEIRKLIPPPPPSPTSPYEEYGVMHFLFSIDGRIKRSTYVKFSLPFWLWCLLTGGLLGSPVVFFTLILTISMICIGIKRCHDVGRKGWFILIPFYWVWLLFVKGDPFDNQYGPKT